MNFLVDKDMDNMKALVMDTGVPQGIFSQPAPTPVKIPSRNHMCGIPTQTGMAQKGPEGMGTCAILAHRSILKMYRA